MKRYLVPLGRLHEWKHPAPERTAYKPTLSFDAECLVFSNRAAMLKACEMSDTGELGKRTWTPLRRELP